MGVAELSNRWLNRFYKVVAILLVTVAVIISAMRLLLPYAHHYRADLQNHINQRYQTDISIGSLTMGWQKTGPILIAEHVKLIDTSSVKASLGRLNLEVDFWSSLRYQKLITTNLTLDEADIYVDRIRLAQESVNTETAEQYKFLDNIIDLFLLQINHFSVINSHITLHENGVDKNFSLSQLNWLNTGLRHQGSGDLILDGFTSDKLKLLIDVQGEQHEDLQGQIYLSANNLNITPWLSKQLVLDDKNTLSDINFDAWAQVEKGTVGQLQLVLNKSKITWDIASQERALILDSGEVTVTAYPSGEYTLQSSPIAISINEHAWQPIEFSGRLSSQGYTELYVSQLDVSGLATIAPLLINNISESDLLNQLSPSGQINDLHWRYLDQQQQVAFNFDDIALNYSQGIPGVDKISGDFVLKGSQIAGQIKSENSALNFDRHFKQPMAFQALTSQFDGYWNESTLQVNVPNIAFTSESLALEADVGVTIPLDEQELPSMALFARVSRGDAQQASQYYPHLLMGEDLVNYLNSGIVKGQVEQAQVLFNGAFNDFPFHEKQGTFVVDTELSNARFSFDSDWPAINHLAANLNFTNNSMLITAREGSLSGLAVEGVTAKIDDLEKGQLLVVNAEFANELPQNIATLMQASPLRESVGEVLTQLMISAPIAGEFQLNLPLEDLDAARAVGKVAFNDNGVTLNTPNMVFTQVKGELFFDNELIHTEGLNLHWRGLPMMLAVKGRDRQDRYQVNIDMGAHWQQEQWNTQVPNTLKNYADGDMNWQGQLLLDIYRDDTVSYDLSINSDLVDTVLMLPEPYQKTAEQKVALSAKVQGQDKQSIINVNLGETLNFYGVLDHEKIQFSRAHLVLGKEQMLLPTQGFHITAKLEQADIEQWQPFVSDILSSVPSESEEPSTPLLTTPERIRGQIASATAFEQTFTDVAFNLTDQTNWWLLGLNAKEARAQVKFYPDWLKQGIDIDADFITLAINDAEDMTAAVEEGVEENYLAELNEELAQEITPEATQKLFDNLPAISMKCASCKVGKFDFGKVSFALERASKKRIVLNNFKAERGKSNIALDGYWLYGPDGQSFTSIKGRLGLDDIEYEMEQLGYASIIKDSGMSSNFDISWLGGPHQFSLSHLNGDLNINLDDGYLADVSDKGARIFSILSLQSLVRKLTFDFRDIFSDGMFYSDIKGDMHLKDGTLYTDNLKMEGAAGDLSIKGNTELSHGVLDYRMSYKPNLTSSLPVLAWIATLEPVTFLAGIAIDQVFTSNVISELDFELTGAVSDPQLKQVNRKTRDITVGRSVSPQFVENKVEKSVEDEGKPDLPLPKPLQNKTDKQENKENL